MHAETEVFARPDRFFQLLERWRDKRHVTRVFAHNLAYHLTMVRFWDFLGRPGLELLYAVVEDPPTIIATKNAVRQTRWVDTMNYWRVSMSELRASTARCTRVAPLDTDPLVSYPEQLLAEALGEMGFVFDY